MFSKPYFLFAVLAITVVSFSGCGGSGLKTVPVSGQVLLDGKPLPNAMVTFVPTDGSRSATGETNENGEFTSLSTLGKGDGAVPGNHMVGINPKTPPPMPGESNPGSEEQAAVAAGNSVLKYNVPAKSGLNAKVEIGKENRFVFELTSEE